MHSEIFGNIVKAPEFPVGLDWINTEFPLTLQSLKGHVIVLDFWTYCCINCMHTLPVLDQLEKKYSGKPVIFIGVHSAKYPNEKDPKNIEQAVLRYEINHPVLVDREMITWERYGVSAWPTIIIIDPRGNIIYKQSGEGQKEMIEDAIDVLLERNSQQGTLSKMPFKTFHRKASNETILSYPGKLDVSDELIAISDSNHNRIVITDLTGQIIHTIGSGEAGFSDGTFENVSFFRPQGLKWDDKILFVADTENHAIRKVDLEDRRVFTVAGTGKQGPWMSQGGRGLETSLSSPWDVAVKDSQVFIAMAGNHQIWALDTERGQVKPFAGTGQENIVDGGRMRAQLAQTSGISIFENKIYFVDSETSSVRELDLANNKVRTIAGSGLFTFGFRDGLVGESLFQHPLGLAATRNKIFVADTYNSALREINLETDMVSTVIGGNSSQQVCRPDNTSCCPLGLYEPGDVKVYQNRLYLADTNNHLVRIYDPKTGLLDTLQIRR